jgi:hypothetical protein
VRKHERFSRALAAAYLDIIILCSEFRTLLQSQKKSTVKRLLQPISPALNSHLDEAITRFRNHRKEVEKEAEVCHMIEEKQARDLVLRNHEAAKARERGMSFSRIPSPLIKLKVYCGACLISHRISAEATYFPTIYNRPSIQTPSNAKDSTPWNWCLVHRTS